MIFDTRCDLLLLVKQGMFDEELYFRISKNTVVIPSLFKRKDDIRIVVDSEIKKLKTKYLKPELEFDKEILDIMYKYSWPNNTREIEKVVDFIICNAKGKKVTISDVGSLNFVHQSGKGLKTLEETEKELIEKMLSQYNNKEQVAKAMGIGRATLYRKLKKYGIK